RQVVTDRNGHQLTYAFSPTGKLETITYPDQTLLVNTYNNLDRLTDSQDSLGLTHFGYDDEGRITDHIDSQGFVLSYGYDAVGNLTRITYPDSSRVTYVYDALNRLEKVRNWLTETTYDEASYTYDEAGRLGTFTQFNGIQTTYTHDAADRLTDMVSRVGTSTVTEYHFTLDANGNRIHSQQVEPLTASPPADTGTVVYEYNTQKNRLLSAGTFSYTYDDEGQLENFHAATDTFRHEFDYDHRLAEIKRNGITRDQFFYDGGGNRLKAIRNGVVTKYIYDPWGNLLAEANESNQITRKYIYGRGLVALKESATQGLPARYCYHFNATGHTVALTDMSGTVVNSYAYDPFGVILAQQESIPQPFKFVGQYGVMAEPALTPDQTGLYYMRARYYDPNVGRFISEDPLGFGGGDVNLFAYVQNDPVNAIDPWGLQSSSSNKPWALFEMFGGVGGSGSSSGGGTYRTPSVRNTTLSPALRGSPYHPDAVSARVMKPSYCQNPAHNPRSSFYNPRKTPEPRDAEMVFRDAIRSGWNEWTGKSSDGSYYKYYSDNAGSAHFSGMIPENQISRDLRELFNK
ncbi:MAG: RHS repeat-associated core domain-containing protein, partial [Syntrophobacteraceae bacterium]